MIYQKKIWDTEHLRELSSSIGIKVPTSAIYLHITSTARVQYMMWHDITKWIAYAVRIGRNNQRERPYVSILCESAGHFGSPHANSQHFVLARTFNVCVQARKVVKNAVRYYRRQRWGEEVNSLKFTLRSLSVRRCFQRKLKQPRLSLFLCFWNKMRGKLPQFWQIGPRNSTWPQCLLVAKY